MKMTDLLSKNKLLGSPEEDNDKIFNIGMTVLIVIMVLDILVKMFWLSPVQVIGSSMNTTLYNSDILLIDKIKEPETGDIVVIKINSTTNYIKRIIGLPGDTVYNDAEGNVYRNGVKIDEPYAYYDPARGYGTFGATSYGFVESGKLFSITLNDGEFFAMGDNRWNSYDGRAIYARGGDFKTSQILGIVPKWVVNNKKSLVWLYKLI